MIGNDITITIIAINGEQVRVGVEAPKNKRILREEIYKQVEMANTGGVINKDSPIDVKIAARNIKGKINKDSPNTQNFSKVTQNSASADLSVKKK